MDKYFEMECISCGVPYLITRTFQQSLRRSKATFHCPNGHQASYTRTPEDDLRHELAQKDMKIRNLEWDLSQANKALTKKKRK